MMRLIALVVACCAVLSDVAAAQTLDRIAATKTVRIGFIADQAIDPRLPLSEVPK